LQAVTYVLSIARADDQLAQPLPACGLLTLGRSRRSDIRLSDKLASAHHAVLAVGATEFSITDLGSRNGTRVGEQVIPAFQPIPIRPGEAVWIGETLLTIDPGADRPAVARAPASGESQPDSLVS
jgi:pSer/pThr/pTyr-binding forkhead associated (FHA) protein